MTPGKATLVGLMNGLPLLIQLARPRNLPITTAFGQRHPTGVVVAVGQVWDVLADVGHTRACKGVYARSRRMADHTVER